MKQTTSEEKKYREFVADVLKYESIDNDLLWMLVRRHIQGYMGRTFFNEKLKEKYYTFWIKRLHYARIIKPHPTYFGIWLVDKGGNKDG